MTDSKSILRALLNKYEKIQNYENSAYYRKQETTK